MGAFAHPRTLKIPHKILKLKKKINPYAFIRACPPRDCFWIRH
jgi:hypothetical protein